MSDVKSLFRKKTKQAVKAKAEPVKPTAEEEEDDEWGVTAKPTEQLYMGDRKAAELIVGAYSDVNLATKVAHDDTKALLHEARKKAVTAATNPEPETPVEAPAPAPAPAEQPGSRWRSRRVLAEQGLAPPPGSSGSSSKGDKTEDFPALGAFPSLGTTTGSVAAGPAPVTTAAATGTWGRVGGEEGAAAPVAAVAAVAPPVVEEKKEPTPTVEAAPPAVKKEEESAPPAAPVVEEAGAAVAPAATAAATSGGDAAVEALTEGVAVVDLKSKFGAKKKKKNAIVIDMDA